MKGKKAKSKKGKGKPKPNGENRSTATPTAKEAQEIASKRQCEPAVEPESCDDRLDKSRMVWKGLSPEEREQLLTISIHELRDKAIAESSSAERESMEGWFGGGRPLIEVLDEALKRKQDHGGWKQWNWPVTRDSFRTEAELRTHLKIHASAGPPQHAFCGDKASLEESAVQLRSHMREVWEEVQTELRAHHERVYDGAVKSTALGRKLNRRARMTSEKVTAETAEFQIDMIIKMMSRLCDEDEYIYQLVAYPIAQFMNSKLPESSMKSRYSAGDRFASSIEVHFDEMSKLTPDQVQELFSWVLERVDLLSFWDSEPSASSPIETLSFTSDGESIVPAGAWKSQLMRYSATSSTGNDAEPDDHLVLEWVYGLVVPMREKAVEGAKRALFQGQAPDGVQLWALLKAAYRQNAKLAATFSSGKTLLHEMLTCRKKVQKLMKDYPCMLEPCVGPERRSIPYYNEAEYPTDAVLSQLEREGALTRAKVHILKHETEQGQIVVQKFRHQQRQGEPKFERLKKLYEEAKLKQRTTEACRSIPDAERNRQAATDAAIEEQLHAQCSFRSQGTYLQGLVTQINATEAGNGKRENEVRQLANWIDSVEKISRELTIESRKAAAFSEAEDARHMVNSKCMKLRSQFFSDLRRQLYTDADDLKYFDDVSTSLRCIQKRLHESTAAVTFLREQLFLVTCDDPGPLITMKLVLPLFRQRLDTLADAHAAKQAEAAEAELLSADVEESAIEPIKAKKKRKPKAKTEVRTDNDAALKASDAAALAREEALRKVEEDQQALREARAKQRELEEELLEKRKQELLSEENGFWRKRMEEEQREKALLAQTQDGSDSSPSRSEQQNRSIGSSAGTQVPGGVKEAQAQKSPGHTASTRASQGILNKADSASQRMSGHMNGASKRGHSAAVAGSVPRMQGKHAASAAAGRQQQHSTHAAANRGQQQPRPQTNTVHATEMHHQPNAAAAVDKPHSAAVATRQQQQQPQLNNKAAVADGEPLTPRRSYARAMQSESEGGNSAYDSPPQSRVLSAQEPDHPTLAQTHGQPDMSDSIPQSAAHPAPQPPSHPAVAVSEQTDAASSCERAAQPRLQPPPEPPSTSPAVPQQPMQQEAVGIPALACTDATPRSSDATVCAAVPLQGTATSENAQQHTADHTAAPARHTEGPQCTANVPSETVQGQTRHGPGAYSLGADAQPQNQVYRPVPTAHAAHPSMVPAHQVMYMPHGHYGTVVYHQHNAPVMAQYLTPYGMYPQSHVQCQPLAWSGNQWNAQAPAFIPTHSTSSVPPGANVAQGAYAGPMHGMPQPVPEHRVADSGARPQEGKQGTASTAPEANGASKRMPVSATAESTDSSESCATVTAAPAEASPTAMPNSGCEGPPEPSLPATDACAPKKASKGNNARHAPLANIKTDASGRGDKCDVKSPGSAGSRSSRKRAAKKARRDIAVLEEEHAARYMLVGGRVGLRNRQGENHCFLNVIVQALYHLKKFSTRLMQLDLDNLPGRQSSHAEWRLLKSLAALFREFETTCEAGSTESSPTLSPDGLRSALPSAFANQGMHDADEVLHELFVALLHAEMGAYGSAQDPLAPVYSFVSETVAKQLTTGRSANEKSWAKRLVLEVSSDIYPQSLTLDTFGMRVQLPGRKPAPPGKVSVERFVRFFHHVYERMLITNHQQQVASNASVSWAQRVKMSGFDSDNSVPLLSRPSVVAIKMVWATPVAGKGHIRDVCTAMADADSLDLAQLFTCVDEPAKLQLRCVIGYAHLHYVAFVQDEQLGWLELDDSTILRTGTWQSVLDRLISSQLQPLVLFYEEF